MIFNNTRPSLVTIGCNCYLNSGLVLLTHDWVAGVMRNVYGEFLNSSSKVTVGNNVRTGYNVTILKGVTISDNVFIAANSLVNKDIPANCIAGGQQKSFVLLMNTDKKDYWNIKRMPLNMPTASQRDLIGCQK